MRIDHLRQIPLESVLARIGATRDGQDRQKWHTERGTVVIEKNGLRNNSFDGSGLHGRGTIDLVMQLHGLQFLEAVRWIDAKYAGAAFEKEHRDLSSNRPANPADIPSPSAVHWPRVKQYLTEKRKLDPRSIDELHEQGAVYGCKWAVGGLRLPPQMSVEDNRICHFRAFALRTSLVSVMVRAIYGRSVGSSDRGARQAGRLDGLHAQS